MGDTLSQSLLAFVEQMRQKKIQEEIMRAQREQQNKIYLALRDELHECMEALRFLAGTQLATDEFSGADIFKTFQKR